MPPESAFTGGRDGRISTCSGGFGDRARRRSITTRATSSGASFQSASPPTPRSPKLVETEPGHDVADADVVVPDFLHQRFAEGVQPGFRRAVRQRRPRRRFLPARLLMLMIQPAAAPLHFGNRGAGAVEHAAQVRVDHLPPVVEAHLADVGESADAGVVHQDVDGAEALHGGVDQPLGIAGHAHVGRERRARGNSRQAAAAHASARPACGRLMTTCMSRSSSAERSRDQFPSILP